MAKRRARNTDGTFVADDPTTPQDEAWEEVPETGRVFGWVAGRSANRQIHPVTNPERKPDKK